MALTRECSCLHSGCMCYSMIAFAEAFKLFRGRLAGRSGSPFGVQYWSDKHSTLIVFSIYDATSHYLHYSPSCHGLENTLLGAANGNNSRYTSHSPRRSFFRFRSTMVFQLNALSAWPSPRPDNWERSTNDGRKA